MEILLIAVATALMPSISILCSMIKPGLLSGRLFDNQSPSTLLGVKEHGEYDKGPEHNLLPINVQGYCVEPVLDDYNEHCAKKGPQNAPPPSRQGGASQHHCRNRQECQRIAYCRE